MKRRGRKRKVKIEKLTKLMRSAEIQSLRFGRLLDSPEDVAQEYACRLLEGRHQRATVYQALLDMAREKADQRRPGYQQQIALNLALPVDPADIHIGVDQISRIDDMMTIEKLTECLSDKQFMVIELSLKGYNLAEIADLLGFTISYIQQVYTKSVVKMRKMASRSRARTQQTTSEQS